jgi:predicted lipid-binding transport protein (Tim44 family)
MTESYESANHVFMIAVIVFYWLLLRIWQQPPPPDHDDKTTGEQAATLAGVALLQLTAPSADAASARVPVPALSSDPFAAIRATDESFDEKSFLAGAARAYELVVNAYVEGDTEVLERLLDPQLAAVFADAILARGARGERTTLTFIGIKDMALEGAWTEAHVAEIGVRFTSEAVAATYAADGSVIDGDSEKVVELADQWTFARSPGSKDPNWKIVATG